MRQSSDGSRCPCAEVLPVGQEGHRSLPAGLAPKANVQWSTFEVVQLLLREDVAVQSRLDVSAQYALPGAIALGESPHDEVVQDRGDQVGASALRRLGGIGASADRRILWVRLSGHGHFSLIRSVSHFLQLERFTGLLRGDPSQSDWKPAARGGVPTAPLHVRRAKRC